MPQQCERGRGREREAKQTEAEASGKTVAEGERERVRASERQNVWLQGYSALNVSSGWLLSERPLPAARSLCPCLCLCHCRCRCRYLCPPWQRLQKLAHIQTDSRYRERARESELQAMHSNTNTSATLAASSANGKTKQKENARCACVRSFAGFHRECVSVWVSVCVPPCLCMCLSIRVCVRLSLQAFCRCRLARETVVVIVWLTEQPGICICIASSLHSQVSRTRKRPCEKFAVTNLELFTLTVNWATLLANNKPPTQK